MLSIKEFFFRFSTPIFILSGLTTTTPWLISCPSRAQNLSIRIFNFSDSTATSQGGDVVHQGHRAGVEEAEVLDGPEEGTVCLHCEVPQVKVVFPKILNQQTFSFFSYIMNSEEGLYLET